MLKSILPPGIAVAEAFCDDPAARLFPGEESAVARAVGKRRAEFATARACARAALAQLGVQPVPIARGPGGAPQWPAGITGSITHCDGYRGAAVARREDAVALGLDAEPDEKLPDGVLDAIALPAERAQVAELAATDPGVCWDRLLFCAKESVYKTWFPLAQRWLDFESAHITIDAGGGFAARILVPGPLTVVTGRWLADRGLLVTAIVL